MALNVCHEPPRPGPELRLVRLREKERGTFVVLGPLWGCYTHWNGQRSEPCFGDSKSCPGHRRGLPVRWKGYLHVIWTEKREECFLEVTPLAAGDLLNVIGGKDAPMRGVRVQIERGAGNKARLRVTLLPAMPKTDHLPQSKDPEEILKDLWNRNDDQKKRQDVPAVDSERQVS